MFLNAVGSLCATRIMLQVTFFPVEGKAKKFFGAFAGVHQEIKTFALDVANVVYGVSTPHI